MRILLSGIAAIALSGCSWMGYQTEGYSGHSANGYSAPAAQAGGYYNPQVSTSHVSTQNHSTAYQYPIATTYPVDFDPNGPLVGNTIYEANAYTGANTAGRYGSQHSAHTKPHHKAKTYGRHMSGDENRWTVSGSLGAEFPTGGDIFSGESAVGPRFNNVSMADAYKPGLRAELGATRSLSGNRMATGHLFYSKAEGEQVTLRDAPSGVRTAQFSDRKSYGAELGLRQYASMPSTAAYKPYVEGRLGAAYVDDIRLENDRLSGVPQGNASGVAFIEGGWVPTAAALIGVEHPVTSNTMIGLETGIRYSGGLDADTIPGSNPGLVGANDYTEHWSVPVSLRGRYRF